MSADLAGVTRENLEGVRHIFKGRFQLGTAIESGEGGSDEEL